MLGTERLLQPTGLRLGRRGVSQVTADQLSKLFVKLVFLMSDPTRRAAVVPSEGRLWLHCTSDIRGFN